MLGTLQDKLLAGGLAVALGVSIVTIIDLKGDLHDERVTVATLDKQINDPKTGYVTRLATCRSNNQTLSGGIDRQNSSIATNAARGAAARGRAEGSVARAQVETDQARRDAADVLARKPEGVTECERVLDLDEQLLESLK